MKLAAWNPFRLKNFVIVALILGIAAGIWLGDLFKGFGLGPGKGPGMGPGAGGGASPGHSSTKLIGSTPDDNADLVGFHNEKSAHEVSGPNEGGAPKPKGLIKVLIDDRDYYVRRGKKLESIKLSALVELIQDAAPNEDGLKAIIERTAASRPTAEDNLIAALRSAGVDKDALLMPEQPVD